MQLLVLVRLEAIGGLVNTHIDVVEGYALSIRRASSTSTRMFDRQLLENILT